MQQPPRSTSRTAVLVVTTTSAFLVPYLFSAINVALPQLSREFAMDAVMLGWVGTGYILATAVFMVPFGRLADIHGRKKAFIGGIMVLSLGCLASVFAHSQAAFVGLRILQGMGGAMISGNSVAILTSIFPANKRGRVIGLNTAATYIGLSVGPLAGGVQTQSLGWRSIFITCAILGAIAISLALWKLKGDWAEAKGQGFDLTGSVIYGIGLVSVMYGFSKLPDLRAVALVVAGFAALVVFGAWEMRARSPVLNLRLFKGNTAFTFSNLAALINYSASFGNLFFLSLYLQYVKGMDPRSAGLVLVVQPAVMAMVTPFAGRLSDRIEPRIVSSVGMGLTTLGLASLIGINSGTSITFLTAVLAVQGLGFGLFSSPNSNAVMSSVEKCFYGVAAATLGTMRLTGQAFSSAMALLIFSLYMGHVAIGPENYDSLVASARTGFTVFALFSFMGIFVSLKRGKIR